jgi:hypothetical protein
MTDTTDTEPSALALTQEGTAPLTELQLITAPRTPMTKHRKRNARRPHAHKRRNANPFSAPRAPRQPKTAEPATETPLQHLLYTAGGAIGASFLGAVAARYGFHPTTVATVITGAGGGIAWLGPQRFRSVAAGAASAGGSQLMLLGLQKAPEAPPAPVVAKRDTEPARVKNADMGALPPGSLEAAFERARADLAIAHEARSHDGYGYAA